IPDPEVLVHTFIQLVDIILWIDQNKNTLNALVLPLVLFVLTVSSGLTWARPYGVKTWNQNHDEGFSSDYNGQPTDLFDPTGTIQLNYDQLTDEANKISRAGYFDGGVWKKTGIAYDWSTVPKIPDPSDPTKEIADPRYATAFTAADYDEIKDGVWHCAPTSAAMAHDYWWNNSKAEVPTISAFAIAMKTNEIGGGPNSGNHRLNYGSFISEIISAIKGESPGHPWSGNYESDKNWAADTANGYTEAERSAYYGEIRAGRPTMVIVEGHATLGVGFDPVTEEVKINDPATGAAGAKLWRRDVSNVDPQHWVQGFITQQPTRLADEPAGNKVFFSNDNFGTGQANAQTPAGDPGDIFGSSLTSSYGRVWEDGGGANDYNGGIVTNGREYPFDIDALDVLKTIQPMNFLTYSEDHGDPNPHDWIPGVSEGGSSYSAVELAAILLPTDWFTAGYVEGDLAAVFATEKTLGLNRAEWSLPGDPLDDDVDAVDLEWDAAFAFSVDFIDTRVFPDFFELDPTGTLRYDVDGNGYWYELGAYDPTDIYGSDGSILDGENFIGLSDNTDIDAIQFISLSVAGVIDGLLFSVDGDAPEAMDRWGFALDPGSIYLSWLNGTAPILFADIGGWDIDAITWSSKPVPESATMFLLGSGLVGIAGLRKKFKKA
ncbi:MAG: C39 family peptidase, partial [Anaerolineales bacterium]|nr:C39 family peptidase [Anaerolineales bacterium]